MALPLSPRLQMAAVMAGAGLSPQDIARRNYLRGFQVGGPRMHLDSGQPQQIHFEQDEMMRLHPEQEESFFPRKVEQPAPMDVGGSSGF